MPLVEPVMIATLPLSVIYGSSDAQCLTPGCAALGDASTQLASSVAPIFLERYLLRHSPKRVNSQTGQPPADRVALNSPPDGIPEGSSLHFGSKRLVERSQSPT